MSQAKSLTRNIQSKRYPLILERDYPNGIEVTCCFCEQRFIDDSVLWSRTWEHLDNDKENQELYNLTFAHWHCNEKKKNDFDMQLFAFEQVKINKEWESKFTFEPARERERENKTATYEQTEIDLNKAHFEIAENFLTEKLSVLNNRYLLSDAVSCIVLRCKKLTGHGSSQSVRNYLNVLSCTEGIYRIEKVEGKSFVQMRDEKK